MSRISFSVSDKTLSLGFFYFICIGGGDFFMVI